MIIYDCNGSLLFSENVQGNRGTVCVHSGLVSRTSRAVIYLGHPVCQKYIEEGGNGKKYEKYCGSFAEHIET
jgi:hypothetical protein